MRLIEVPYSVSTSRASRCCLSMAVSSSRERRGLVLRKGWLFQEVRIPKNVDIFVYEMMHAARRSAETPRRRSARLQADHPSLTILIVQRNERVQQVGNNEQV